MRPGDKDSFLKQPFQMNETYFKYNNNQPLKILVLKTVHCRQNHSNVIFFCCCTRGGVRFKSTIKLRTKKRARERERKNHNKNRQHFKCFSTIELCFSHRFCGSICRLSEEVKQSHP